MVAPFFPELGLVTALFEIGVGLWTLTQRKHGRVLFYTIAGTQFLLAGYQLAEVCLCWFPSLLSWGQHEQLFVSRLAFLDITWLPPLSLLIISNLVVSPPRWLHQFARVSVALGILFSIWIIADTRFVTGTMCSFMYAKYQNIEPYIHLYGAYYELTQMSMIFIPAVLFVGQPLNVQKDLRDVLLGALLFILPALFLAAVKHELFAGALPSLMCHFALFYSLFLWRLVRRRVSA